VKRSADCLRRIANAQSTRPETEKGECPTPGYRLCFHANLNGLFEVAVPRIELT